MNFFCRDVFFRMEGSELSQSSRFFDDLEGSMSYEKNGDEYYISWSYIQENDYRIGVAIKKADVIQAATDTGDSCILLIQLPPPRGENRGSVEPLLCINFGKFSCGLRPQTPVYFYFSKLIFNNISPFTARYRPVPLNQFFHLFRRI